MVKAIASESKTHYKSIAGRFKPPRIIVKVTALFDDHWRDSTMSSANLSSSANCSGLKEDLMVRVSPTLVMFFIAANLSSSIFGA